MFVLHFHYDSFFTTHCCISHHLSSRALGICGRMQGLGMEQVDGDVLERGRESRDEGKVHTSRALSFWCGDLAAPAPLPRAAQQMHLLQYWERRWEEQWWGQEAWKGLGSCILDVCQLRCWSVFWTNNPSLGPWHNLSVVLNLPALKTHLPQSGSAWDLEVMSALPGRCVPWKLAALIYQSQPRTSPWVLGSPLSKIPWFPSQKGCAWYTTGMRWEHTHTLQALISQLRPKHHKQVSIQPTSPIISDGQLCLSPAQSLWYKESRSHPCFHTG